MTLFRLKSAPFILIEDDSNKNILPLLLELVDNEKELINLFCYEQPSHLWRKVFKKHPNTKFFNDFNTDCYNKYINGKSAVIIDSVNQMALCMGWYESLKIIRKLQDDSNVVRLILILHKDCLPNNSKLQTYLNHLVNVVVSYDRTKSSQIHVRLKKGSKIIRSDELISYDSKGSILKITPVVKEHPKEEETVKPSPENLSTFKIEVGQTEKIQKYNLKLPYMSKIHEGQSKVYYEPDAVDDWDEEDPDEDLDI